MKRLVMIGAGGHGRVCAEIAALCGYNSIVFLDDGVSRSSKMAIAGTTDRFTDYLDDSDFFVALGNNRLRRSFQEKIEKSGGRMATLIHPDATVSDTVKIGAGSVVMPGAVINVGATIGKGVIVNTCSSADHDCRIGDFCHIAVGAHLAGLVIAGENTFFGAGSIAVNNIQVPADTIIGAGAVVIRSLPETGTYVGIPAVKIS